MSQVVWKYPLDGEHTVIELPAGSRVLHAGVQGGGDMFVWVLRPKADLLPQSHIVTVVGTGHPVPDGAGDHVGSIQAKTPNGVEFVFHIFDAIRDGQW